MWGGAWLTVDGLPVDVLFRDLDRVEGWLEEARAGRFEVLPQSGHIVGAPTYQAAGELALCRPLSGDVPRPDYPEPLAASAPGRWLGGAAVALTFARIHAGLGDAVACTGMLSQAVLCTAHARLAARARMGAQREAARRAGGPRARAGALRAAGRSRRRRDRRGRAARRRAARDPLTRSTADEIGAARADDFRLPRRRRSATCPRGAAPHSARTAR